MWLQLKIMVNVTVCKHNVYKAQWPSDSECLPGPAIQVPPFPPQFAYK